MINDEIATNLEVSGTSLLDVFDEDPPTSKKNSNSTNSIPAQVNLMQVDPRVNADENSDAGSEAELQPPPPLILVLVSLIAPNLKKGFHSFLLKLFHIGPSNHAKTAYLL